MVWQLPRINPLGKIMGDKYSSNNEEYNNENFDTCPKCGKEKSIRVRQSDNTEWYACKNCNTELSQHVHNNVKSDMPRNIRNNLNWKTWSEK